MRLVAIALLSVGALAFATSTSHASGWGKGYDPCCNYGYGHYHGAHHGCGYDACCYDPCSRWKLRLPKFNFFKKRCCKTYDPCCAPKPCCDYGHGYQWHGNVHGPRDFFMEEGKK